MTFPRVKSAPNYVVDKRAGAERTITLLKLDVANLALGVRRRLLHLRRQFMEHKGNLEEYGRIAELCLKHEDMLLRIQCHPLPPRAKLATYRNGVALDVVPLDIEPLPMLPAKSAAEPVTEPVTKTGDPVETLEDSGESI